MKRLVTFCCALFLALHAFGQFNPGNAVFIASLLVPPATGGTTPDLWWAPMNDASGTTVNATVGPDATTDGTLNNDYLALASASSQQLQTDSSITFGSSVVTLAGWIYAVDWTGAAAVILESGPNYGSGPVRFEADMSSSTLTFNIGTSGLKRTENCNVITIGLQNATWYHFGIVYDNNANAGDGDIKFYTNGVAVTLSATPLSNSTGNFATEVLNLGSRNAASDFFDGRFDDWRVYSTEKDATFLLGLFNAGRP